VDLFPLYVFGGLALLVGLLVLVARLYPGSGADLLDWGPTRSYEQEIELENQDVEQMLEAQNAYRRRKGQAELSEEEMRRGVVQEELRRLRGEG
jgi:hypothetical protein